MKNALSLLLVTALLFTGCQMFNPIAPIVQLGIRWYDGEAQKYYNTDQVTLYNATKAALAELNLPIAEESHEDNIYYLKVDAGDRFKIKVVGVREEIAKLSIRVNTMGDKEYAELIYRHVDSQTAVKQFASLEALNAAMESTERPKPFKKLRHRLEERDRMKERLEERRKV